jgi:hypothetical protein
MTLILRSALRYSCIATGVALGGTGAIGAAVGISYGINEVKSPEFCQRHIYKNARGVDKLAIISVKVLRCGFFGAALGPYVAAEKAHHMYKSFTQK